MFRSSFSVVTFCTAFSLCLTGCASLNKPGSARTSVDRAIENCVGTVFVGAVGGAIIGGIAGGSRNAGRGAIIGGAAGGVACAVMLAVANEEDKARILANERAAVASGTEKSEIYDRSGIKRRIATKVYDEQPKAAEVKTPPAPKAKTAAKPAQTAKPPEPPLAQVALPANQKLCRYAETTIEVDGQGATTTDRQLYCRSSNGDWEPAAIPT